MAVREIPRAWHTDLGNDAKVFPSPIAGCNKVFHGSRGDWDGHLGALRLHPDWHPELQDAEERRRRFKIEFPGFLS